MASPVDQGVDLLGKLPEDLQTGITITSDQITGTLNYVTGYTGFSSDVAEQSGHYLALKFDATPVDAVTTVEIVGGTSGEVTLDADMLFVGLIKDAATQKIRVKTTANEKTVTKVYGLTGLTLAAQ